MTASALGVDTGSSARNQVVIGNLAVKRAAADVEHSRGFLLVPADGLEHASNVHALRVGQRRESAATAVCWALIVTGIAYKSLAWRGFLTACAKACKTTGVVLLLIGISSAFGYFMALYEVPQKTGELMQSISTEPWVIFLMINLLLFILGTFLDMAATILICTPIFMPIAMQFGMDPLQFGILMLINCALGLNTPPVGTVQFVGCAIGGISVGQVMRTIAPFYGALGLCLLLVTYVPAFSLWLPHLLQ